MFWLETILLCGAGECCLLVTSYNRLLALFSRFTLRRHISGNENIFQTPHFRRLNGAKICWRCVFRTTYFVLSTSHSNHTDTLIRVYTGVLFTSLSHLRYGSSSLFVYSKHGEPRAAFLTNLRRTQSFWLSLSNQNIAALRHTPKVDSPGQLLGKGSDENRGLRQLTGFISIDEVKDYSNFYFS